MWLKGGKAKYFRHQFFFGSTAEEYVISQKEERDKDGRKVPPSFWVKLIGILLRPIICACTPEIDSGKLNDACFLLNMHVLVSGQTREAIRLCLCLLSRQKQLCDANLGCYNIDLAPPNWPGKLLASSMTLAIDMYEYKNRSKVISPICFFCQVAGRTMK